MGINLAKEILQKKAEPFPCGVKVGEVADYPFQRVFFKVYGALTQTPSEITSVHASKMKFCDSMQATGAS